MLIVLSTLKWCSKKLYTAIIMFAEVKHAGASTHIRELIISSEVVCLIKVHATDHMDI